MNCDVAIWTEHKFLGSQFSKDFLRDEYYFVTKHPKLDLFVQRRDDNLMYYAWRFRDNKKVWTSVYMCCNGVYLPFGSVMAAFFKLRMLNGKVEAKLKKAESIFRNDDIACEPLPPLEYGKTLPNKFTETPNPDVVALYAGHNTGFAFGLTGLGYNTQNERDMSAEEAETYIGEKRRRRKKKILRYTKILAIIGLLLGTFAVARNKILLKKYEQEQEEQRNSRKLTQEVETFMVKGVRFTMIKVKGGRFLMGATEEQGSNIDKGEKPVHKVTLSDYYIGQTEVTQELWNAVMEKNPSWFNKKHLPWFEREKHHPVERVSWEDCQDFIRELNILTGQNFRLPTEAEWEFAARGGNKSNSCKYSGSNAVDKVAWYGNNSDSTTHPVATKQANELGLYDMSGNVWEWCSDWYDYYTDFTQINPKGAKNGTYRVLRGGAWSSTIESIRVSSRNCIKPSYSSYDLGLRLAL